jgi:hypothetical protein
MDGGTPSNGAEIPFSTFVGDVKQLETNFKLPLMRELFDCCFSAFAAIDRMYADLKRQGIDTIVSAAGAEFNFGSRPRRFAGGPGLAPDSYFTLCDGGRTFVDGGTLRDELTAYFSAASGMTPLIFDPKVEKWLIDYLRTNSSARMSEEDLAYPFYYIRYQIERATEANDPLRQSKPPLVPGETIGITYGVRQFACELERIVDLRLPDTQEWFHETFVGLELDNEQRAAEEVELSFPPKSPLKSFRELLPVIVSLETGGGMIFGQAVGQWLRRHGANGLIFPSARSNAFNRVRGEPIDWTGWNLVVYADAEPPVSANLFGRMATWRDRDHDHIRIKYVDDGLERGSFSIRGAREFNLLEFDRKKQIACGLHDENVVADITGQQNAALSQAVNAILDLQERAGSIWYEDIDYIDFVLWHEERWRTVRPHQ